MKEACKIHGRMRFLTRWQGSTLIVAGISLLVPLCSLTLEISANTQKLLLFAVGLALLCGFEAVSLWRTAEKAFSISWVFLALIAWIAASLVSLVNAGNSCFAWLSLIGICLSVLYALTVSQRACSRRFVHWVLAALLAAGTVASLLALAQYLGWAGDANATDADRIVSTLGNRNYLGGFLGYLVFPLAALSLRSRTRIGQALTIAGLTVCMFTTLLVQQTGIMLSLAVGLGFLMLGVLVFRLGRTVWALRRPLVLLLVPLVAALGLGLAHWWYHPYEPIDLSTESVIEGMWTANYGALREVNWLTAWEMFSAHPWTGVGLGNYKIEFLTYKAAFLESPRGQRHVEPMTRAVQAHNDYLQLLAELGWPGAIALLISLLLGTCTFWRRIRRAPGGEHRFELLLLISGLVVIMAHAMVSFPFHLPVSALVFITLVGVSTSPLYGEAASFRFRLHRRGNRMLAALILAVGIACAVGAIREGSAQLSLHLGRRELARESYEQSHARFERSVALSVCPAQARFLLAYSNLHLSDAAGAEGDVERAYASLLAAHEESARALEAYFTEDALLLASTTAVRLGDADAAEQYAIDLLRTRPKARHEREARFVLAFVDVLREETLRAEAALHRLIDAFPGYPSAYVLLARIQVTSDRVDEARSTLEQATWAISQAIDQIDQALPTAGAPARSELESERRRLSVGLVTVLRDYQALPP